MGVNLLLLLVSYPRHWFPSYYCSHSLSRKSACTLGVNVTNVQYSETMHTKPAPSLIALQGPRPVTEAWSALRNLNLTVPVFHPCYWVRSGGHISIRQLFLRLFSLHVTGAQPYLAIKVQGNVTCYLRRCRNFGSKSCTQLVRLC